jgi:hypothetical protein
MRFVREKISGEDIVAYGLKEINDDFFVVGFSNGWVIDRSRNIYLRWMRYYREDPSEAQFTFFWKDVLLDLNLFSSHPPDDDTFERKTTWTLATIPLALTPELKVHREQILNDLREALIAYGSFGMSSTSQNHEAEFKF